MGIKQSILRHFQGPAKPAPQPVRWRHEKWPARNVEQFVVSFPKSGRTWLRVLMGAADARRSSATLDTAVGEWLARDVPILDGRAVLFTHALAELPEEPADHLHLFQRYIGDRRRVFLVRDPRDVVVSYFFQRTKRKSRLPGEVPETLAEFVRDERFGIDRILRFMRACDESMREDPGPALLLSYEELHQDAERSLARAMTFFGIPELTADDLRRAVEYGKFDNMRKLETSRSFDEANKRLRAADPRDEESLKTRKGKVGGYGEYLSPEDIAFVEERIAALVPRALGYASPGIGPAVPEGP